MKSEIPFSGIGAKSTAKTQPLLLRQNSFSFFLDLTERRKSDEIAHGSIIQVSTVPKITCNATLSMRQIFQDKFNSSNAPNSILFSPERKLREARIMKDHF